MVIREMSISDYDSIFEFWKNTPGMGMGDADKRENIQRFLERNKGLSFVCEAENCIIGTILCGHDGRRGYIYHLGVDAGHRGRGIGQRLVEQSLSVLKREGIVKCHLFVFNDNELGIGFYNKTGWIKRDDIFAYSKNI